MSTNSGINDDTFQTFLANSFAVQESGLDSKSLSSLVELQRFLRGDAFDLETAFRMVAEHARMAASAAGVAIALLEYGDLVYRAGAGSAAKDIGRRVPAVLSMTSAHQIRSEILRVENASADTRIEAEICRQFGAMSLLMLPVYKNQVVAGVLQVNFDEAHRFDEREIRIYRLMIGALECGIVRHFSDVQAAEELSVSRRVSETRLDSLENAETVESAAATEVAEIVREEVPNDQCDSGSPVFAEQPGTRAWLTYRSMLVPDRSVLWFSLKNLLRKGRTGLWSADLRYSGAAIGVVVAVSMATWIAHRDRFPNRNLSAPAVREGSGKALPSSQNGDLTAATNSKSDPVVLNGFRRVRVSRSEVDEISDDVTIRYFDPELATPRIRTHAKEVKFGEDVTVRYFPDGPLTESVPASTFESGATPQGSIQSR